jgi:hypothetical protein
MKWNTGQEVVPPPLLQPSPYPRFCFYYPTPLTPGFTASDTPPLLPLLSTPPPSFRCHARPAQLTARGVSVSGESTMLIFNPALSLLTTKVWAMDKLDSPRWLLSC